MDEDKIVLDRKSFEALAVDSRVKILKSLKQRRKTLSELAKEQKMSVSGVKEHLETLEKVDLIEKIDDGHKWKYYELTKKGKEIIAPREIRVWILLAISIFALVLSLNSMIPVNEMALQQEVPQPSGENLMVATSFENNSDLVLGTVANQAKARNDSTTPMDDTKIDNWPVIIAIISSFTMLGCIGILIRNRYLSQTKN